MQARKRIVAPLWNCKTELIFALWRAIRRISICNVTYYIKLQFEIEYVVMSIVIALITVMSDVIIHVAHDSFNRAPNVFFRCIIFHIGKKIWLWLSGFPIHKIWIDHVMLWEDIFPMWSKENTFQTCRNITKSIIKVYKSNFEPIFMVFYPLV